MYHMVAKPENDAESHFCRTPAAFRSDMEDIRRAGYRVIPLAAALDALEGKTDIPDRAVVITFDDGLACAYENAFPVLQEYGYPGTVFVISGLLGGTIIGVRNSVSRCAEC